jgi:phage shock protein A
MKKKESKKEFSKEDLARHLGAMAESYKDDVKATREGVAGITQILERMEKTLDSHTEEIANLRMDMTEVKSNVKDIKLNIRFGLDDKVDKKHFVDLDSRVRVLEKK